MNTDGQGSAHPAPDSQWEHLAQLARAATPGGWKVDDEGCCVYGGEEWHDIAHVVIDASGTEADAEFIAAADPIVVLALIAERDEALADSGRWHDNAHTLAGRALLNAETIMRLRAELADTIRRGQALANELETMYGYAGIDPDSADNKELRSWREQERHP